MQIENLDITASKQELSAQAENNRLLTHWHQSPTPVVVDLTKAITPRDSHVETNLDDDYRHWSPESEPLAPADVLLQYLRKGWLLDVTVEIKSHQCRSCRYVDIYCFTLHHHARPKPLQMPVLANPIVRKVVQQHGLKLIHVFDELITDNFD